MEFHDKFTDNWNKILKYNSERISSKEKVTDTTVRIPLMPIEIDASSFFMLCKILYPTFVNDQQNILDLIQSENNENVIQAFLHRTRIAGVHESTEKLPLDLFREKIPIITEKNHENLDVFFNKLQLILADKKQVKISSLRIFNEKIVSLINTLLSGDNTTPALEYYRSLLNILQEAFDRNLFYMHPVPSFIQFFENVLKFLDDIRFSTLFTFLIEIFPESSIGIVLTHEKGNFLVSLAKNFRSRNKNLLKIQITSADEILEELTKTGKQNSIKKIMSRKRLDLVFQFHLEDIVSLAQDLFSIQFPLSNDTIQFIAQKMLFGFRSYGNLWFRTPTIKLYNLKRFLVRILGINLNIRKLSHWSIPTRFFEILASSFGLNSKFLILLTDINSKNGKKGLKNSLDWSGIVKFENGTLSQLIPIEKEHLLTEEGINRLEDVKSKAAEEHGSISAVLKVDKTLLKYIVRFLVFQTPTLNIFKVSKVLKQFKQDSYFEVCPEVPFVAFLKNSRPFKLIKALTSVMVNKYEF